MDEPTLRGFRKRWDRQSRSDASGVQSGEDGFGLGALPFEGSECGSWLALPEYNPSAVEDGSLDYEPSIGETPDFTADVGSEEPVQVTGDPNAEFDWKCEALQSVAKRAKLFGDKLPWEHSAFSGIFGKTDIFAGTFAAGYKYSLAPTSIGAVEVLQSEVITARKTETPSSSTSPPVSSLVLIGSRREAADEDIRRMALSKLRDLILGDPAATNLGISLKSSVSSLIEQSFSDCFRSKASTTLQKRANSLWRLSKLLASRGMLTLLRLTEEDLYMAVCSLRESKAGATSGQRIIEALHFLDGTAGLSLVDVRSFISGRCRGVARDMFLGKDPLQQKYPLRVEQVAWLEELIQHSSSMHGCVIGQLLFCVHAACRWRDSQRLKKIDIEYAHDESLLNADAISSKTALTLDAKTRFIPYAALGVGIGGVADWAQKWLQSRAEEGLLMEDFILPSFSQKKGLWLDQPMSAAEATCWLREYLAQRFPGEDLSMYSSHSCKSTLLTWAGRSTVVVFTMPERRILGHHMDPSSKSVLTYARESYTSLYAKVLLMYLKIRSGEFKPDLRAIERVLQFATSAEATPETGATDAAVMPDQQASVVTEELLVESDSESSSASDVELTLGLSNNGPDGDILGSTDFPGVTPCDLLVHSTSGLVHVVNEDDFLLCGRLASRNFKPLSEISFAGHIESCQHCLRIFTRAKPGVVPS